ncbi:hypothetical protein TNCV_4136901 [Trichonephila clavipes]|nr:hypothetical protein TNCV_4136901 [Trichonephila clavipes]
MECRSSDIKIYPPVGNNFKGYRNFLVSQTGKFLQVFVTEDTVDRALDSFCESPDDKSIRQACNGIPFHSNTSLYTRD